MGRKESVWGHIGVIKRAGISGWTSEPPADSYEKQFESISKETGQKHTEYAVDPVGVETVSPSA